MDEDGRVRLARMIRDRRVALGLSVRQAAVDAGIDRGTWASAESGSRQTAMHNYAGIERALHWDPGSVARILAGGNPGETGAVRPQQPATVDEIMAEIERVYRLDLPATAKLRLIKPLNDLLEQATTEQRRAAG